MQNIMSEQMAEQNEADKFLEEEIKRNDRYNTVIKEKLREKMAEQQQIFSEEHRKCLASENEKMLLCTFPTATGKTFAIANSFIPNYIDAGYGRIYVIVPQIKMREGLKDDIAGNSKGKVSKEEIFEAKASCDAFNDFYGDGTGKWQKYRGTISNLLFDTFHGIEDFDPKAEINNLEKAEADLHIARPSDSSAVSYAVYKERMEKDMNVIREFRKTVWKAFTRRFDYDHASRTINAKDNGKGIGPSKEELTLFKEMFPLEADTEGRFRVIISTHDKYIAMPSYNTYDSPFNWNIDKNDEKKGIYYKKRGLIIDEGDKLYSGFEKNRLKSVKGSVPLRDCINAVHLNLGEYLKNPGQNPNKKRLELETELYNTIEDVLKKHFLKLPNSDGLAMFNFDASVDADAIRLNTFTVNTSVPVPAAAFYVVPPHEVPDSDGKYIIFKKFEQKDGEETPRDIAEREEKYKNYIEKNNLLYVLLDLSKLITGIISTARKMSNAESIWRNQSGEKGDKDNPENKDSRIMSSLSYLGVPGNMRDIFKSNVYLDESDGYHQRNQKNLAFSEDEEAEAEATNEYDSYKIGVRYCKTDKGSTHRGSVEFQFVLMSMLPSYQMRHIVNKMDNVLVLSATGDYKGVSVIDNDYASMSFKDESDLRYVPSKEISEKVHAIQTEQKKLHYDGTQLSCIVMPERMKGKTGYDGDLKNPYTGTVFIKGWFDTKGVDYVDKLRPALVLDEMFRVLCCYDSKKIGFFAAQIDTPNTITASEMRDRFESLEKEITPESAAEFRRITDGIMFAYAKSGKIYMEGSTEGISTEEIPLRASNTKLFILTSYANTVGYNYTVSSVGGRNIKMNLSCIVLNKATQIVPDIRNSGSEFEDAGSASSKLCSLARFKAIDLITGSKYTAAVNRTAEKILNSSNPNKKDPLPNIISSPYKIQGNINYVQAIGRFRMDMPSRLTLIVIDHEIISENMLMNNQFTDEQKTLELAEVINKIEAEADKYKDIQREKAKANKKAEELWKRAIACLAQEKNNVFNGGGTKKLEKEIVKNQLLKLAALTPAIDRIPNVKSFMMRHTGEGLILPEYADLRADDLLRYHTALWAPIASSVVQFDSLEPFKKFIELKSLLEDAQSPVSSLCMAEYTDLFSAAGNEQEDTDGGRQDQVCGIFMTDQAESTFEGEYAEIFGQVLTRYGLNEIKRNDIRILPVSDMKRMGILYQYEDCDMFLSGPSGIIMVDWKNRGTDKPYIAAEGWTGDGNVVNLKQNKDSLTNKLIRSGKGFTPYVYFNLANVYEYSAVKYSYKESKDIMYSVPCRELHDRILKETGIDKKFVLYVVSGLITKDMQKGDTASMEKLKDRITGIMQWIVDGAENDGGKL